ncbi:bifunctional diaminohydroxyphosphoribosylaminopyrimidine deaminase/5-amino-6-(5-phosphoribosylamino)uracil reductase RibD [Pontivivens insulae]|uniref:Riboflavin biosynthesis protein RibD n=1 Tax=Pontivivens insulae TaxID=1639689 RepID=A0A2R8AC57_9RHOB|nr:bifunctional diaminohydroxyphosphoribosylaminopyrimidine deaminase/5-amino-6-(5-phosphoribosylamino)uracil reductase RibD [Pontivivens insulae]RED11161.1 diaminohydroxyphosphoribosylaminopyrimidine deaminase [Pontivivens insulae]SPF29665.1 Riboflavin biosynthesis protein RibD [Pontivivens insulae]
MNEADARHLTHAINLSRRGLGRTWPNPAVGCVLVKSGRILGRGWTQPGGRPHAETMALAQAGDAAQGADAYVSLEPCAHHGRTPPCADALVNAGIARLICPMEDPDPRVSGKGLGRLRDAGVEVIMAPEFASEASDVNAGFLRRQELGRPLVTLKLALSLDGRIATVRGESRWITGPQARREVHLMRANHDAVLIGAGTARADDPMLDIRELGLADASPVRVIADGSLSLSLTSRLAQTAELQPLWICHKSEVERDRRAAWDAAGARTLPCATDGDTGALDLAELLQVLGREGITRILCEGGGQLAASLLRRDLVDRLVIMQAGLVLGRDGLAGVGAMADQSLADFARWRLVELRRIGSDTMSEFRPLR